MIHNLKPYPAYKYSGVPWLGEVPEHWKVQRLKAAVSQVNDQTSEKRPDEVYVALEHVESWTGRVQLPNNDITFDSQVKRFRPDDVLFGKLRPYLAKVARLSVDGVCVGEFLVLRPNKSDVSSSFLENVLRSKSVIDVINSSTFGAKMPRADWSFIGNLLLCIPSPSEQSAIVLYLDHIDRRIRRYIRTKLKLIKLLEEQKQAIVHQAVTRGLDPNVQLKPSGVEWLGDVPESWEIVSLRHLATKFGSGITPRGGATVYKQKGIPFLRSQNIHFDGLRLDNVAYIDPDLHHQLSSTHVHPGEVLLNITGASIGRVCFVPDTFKEGNVNQHVCIIRPIKRLIFPEYLSAYLSTPQMQKEIRIEQNGASREGLAQDAIRSFKILLPPVDEQIKIIQSIRQQTQKLISFASYAEDEISLLREYRTRLIADVVTGKLDVREAAAKVTDEAEEMDIEEDPEEETTEENLEEVISEDND